jgi:hypothetical protein
MLFSGLPAVRVAVSALADHLTRAPPVVRSVIGEGSPDQLTTEERRASTMGFVETAFPRHDSEVRSSSTATGSSTISVHASPQRA